MVVAERRGAAPRWRSRRPWGAGRAVGPRVPPGVPGPDAKATSAFAVEKLVDGRPRRDEFDRAARGWVEPCQPSAGRPTNSSPSGSARTGYTVSGGAPLVEQPVARSKAFWCSGQITIT